MFFCQGEPKATEKEAAMTGTTQGSRKTTEGGRGDPHKASPIAIEYYLKGINFPADKEDLVEQAKDNDAPDDVFYVLRRFEEKSYKTGVDIAKEVRRIESANTP